MAIDPEIQKHKEWLGFLQPVGLVVSPTALVKAQAIVNRNVVDLQQTLLSVISRDLQLVDDSRSLIFDFPLFTVDVLGWEPSDLVSGEALKELRVALPDYGETLAPSYAVQDDDGWLLLIQVIAPGASLDEVDATHETASENRGKWSASPQAKFERLLRETGVPIGILCNGTEIRLVYAPKGESSGHLTFPVQAMCEVTGRLILGAMEMLLSAYRLFTAPTGRRLKDLLEESRKYQAEVSTTLADQVVDALWELLRGFQMADAATSGKLLGELATHNPQHIYGGLITTLMRLVFLLYAEDEGLMPGDDLYQHNYSVSGLFERLRADEANYTDTMDQRYGAWAWLLSLFRLVYDGGGETPEYLPARHGQLFDPDEYAFLEGRVQGSHFDNKEPIEPPRIPDGVIYRMLDRLLILKGERLSYRSLDVEQIGSVYESVMGYAVERASSPVIGVRSKPPGAKVSVTVVVDVVQVLETKADKRASFLKETAGCKLSSKSLTELKAAKKPEEIVAALGRRVSRHVPDLLPAGTLYLQPGEERRRSGSHYTPRSLTEPIVRTTLRPVLEALGDRPTAEQILSLKIADIAMGSGAFLVEACRQLAEQVEAAWSRDGLPETLPEGEEPLLFARRLVAQRCLYGVDKNPFAVNLARLSLWLVTLSKTLPFTFLDHSLKCGDSLVGVKRKAILEFSQKAVYQPTLEDYQRQVEAEATARILETRQKIQNADTQTDEDEEAKRLYLQETEDLLRRSRLAADLMVSAFFEGTNPKQRAAKLEEFLAKLKIYSAEGLDLNPAREGLVADAMIQAEFEGKTRKQRQQKQQEYGGRLIGYESGWVNAEELWQISERLRTGRYAVIPFNWEEEFLEVFERENPGFDCIIGNPPFLGGRKISGGYGKNYLDWLFYQYPETGGQADFVTYFFRRAFVLLRENGTLGLIATNTIAQGDTRSAGLAYICRSGGQIYNARKRVPWTGSAAVIVSVVHILRGLPKAKRYLDGREVPTITAYLLHMGSSESPHRLLANSSLSFKGQEPYGKGFLFANDTPEATSIAEMEALIQKDSRNLERIFPYLGGHEILEHPKHLPSKFVINFNSMSREEASRWPDLFNICEQKVKVERSTKAKEVANHPWWRFWRVRAEMQQAIAGKKKFLAHPFTSTYLAFAFVPERTIVASPHVVVATNLYSGFGVVQSQIHEIWVRLFGSSMKDDLRYTPSDCFETFPFPENWEIDSTLEAIGKQYYEFRAELMVRNNEGLTQTYNRFHDPDEFDPDILQLRQLHDEMDRAVLAAYGWSDIQPQCEFLLDYEDEAEDDEETSKRQRKKPYRYRWNEATHDEVLARLLLLNQQRYEQEILGGKPAGKSAKGAKGTRKGKTAKAETSAIPGLEA